MAQITAVIPLYNKGKYIKRAIDSVLSQTFQDFDIIVVNDASSDGGEKAIKDYHDKRISLYNRQSPSPGGHAARNLGIEKARTELVAFLDADDEWTPGFLDTVLRLKKKFPHVGAYTTAYMEQDSNKRISSPKLFGIPRQEKWEGIIPDYFLCALRGASPFCTISVAIPKRIFQDVGFFPEGVPRGGDHDMWTRIALKHDIAFSKVAGAIYHKYIPGSIVKTNKVLHGYRVVDTIDKYISENPAIPAVRLKHICEYADKKRLGSAAQSVKAGEILLAKKHLDSCITKSFILKRTKLRLLIFLSKIKRIKSSQ